jgi:hypothetical protein
MVVAVAVAVAAGAGWWPLPLLLVAAKGAVRQMRRRFVSQWHTKCTMAAAATSTIPSRCW